MSSEAVKGAIVPGQQSSMNGEVAEATVTSGGLGVRTGAAIVAENSPPPLQELALGEPPHTTTPSPSLGLHGSKPSSVESRAPEEKQPLSSDMVVPVKAGDSADAKQTKSEVTDQIRRPKTPSGSSRPPSSNGNAPAPSSPITRPLSSAADEDSSDMGAEGSKFGAGKFRKASSADLQPLEEKVSVAKRSASSSSGFIARNGRGSATGADASNGHREFVQSVAEEQEKSVAHESTSDGRPPSRQDASPLPGKVEEKRKSPPLGPPSPVPNSSKSPTGARVSSKPSSPDLVVHPVSSPKKKPDSPLDHKGREVIQTKTPSPDLRETPDSSKGKVSSPDTKKFDTDDKKSSKSPSPDLLKTKPNGSLRTSPEPGNLARKPSEDSIVGESLKVDSSGRKTPGSEDGGSKSPLPPKSKTPSPDLRNIAEVKSVSPDVTKKGTQESSSPEPSKERQLLEQIKGSTPSPESARGKSGSPEILGSTPSPPLKTKSNSPDLKKEVLKTSNDSDTGSSGIKDVRSQPIDIEKSETKHVLKQKVSSPELGISKSPSPDAPKEKFRSDSSLNRANTDEKLNTKSPDLLPKTPSPDVSKSKPLSPEPSKGKPVTPEPPRSKTATPEPSKSKMSSLDGSDVDLRRSSSRLSNISDNGPKGSPSPTPPKTKSPSPELGKPKSDSPDLLTHKRKSPNLPSPSSSSPEPDKTKSTGVDLRSVDSNIPEQEIWRTSEGKAGKPSVADSTKSASISPEPDKLQGSHEPMRSKPSTPEPLKFKSPSQESIKTEEIRTSSPKPLQKRPSYQKLSSKSPSPETGHRTSNPPSLPPSPEPMKLNKSPSPDIICTKSPSLTQVMKDFPSTDSSGTSVEKKAPSESPDIAAVRSSPSPDMSKQKKSPEDHKTPSEVQADTRASPTKVSEVTASEGKVSPTKHAEEVIGKPPLMKKVSSPSPEPVKTPSPLPPKSVSPKVTREDSPGTKKSPSPTSLKPTSPEAFPPSDTSEGISSLPPKSATPDSTKSMSSGSPKPPSPLIPKSPSPTTDKPPKSPSVAEGKSTFPTVPKPPSPSSDKPKSPSPVAKKPPTPEFPERKVVTPDKPPILAQEKVKTATSHEPMKPSVDKIKDKSPSLEMDEQRDKTSAQPERTKRPGSRQGISPEVVLSPSEDSGRTSASPDHFERKSSTPPKPASPLPSSASPRVRTPTSPVGSKDAGDARTPEAKATAASSPTSEVGDEASSTSRTGSASARASSAEAATPDEEAKIEGSGEEAPDDESKRQAGRKQSEKAEEDSKKKKAEASKPSTPSKTPRAARSVAASPRTPRRTTPRSRRKDGGHEKISGDTKGKSVETKPSTNGEVCSPTKKSPTKIPAKKSPGTPTAATSSPARPPLKSPAKSKTPPALAAAPTPESEKKKVPMNKVQVGTAASPNLKAVRSKIGSLDNASYKPGGGKVKIENRKLDFSKTAPKIAAKNDAYVPGGGDKKIQQVKLTWSAKPKVGSLDNATYRPGGGEKKIETVKLDFKEKAKPKVGSKDNIKHAPGGGTVKKTSGTKDDPTSDIESQKLEFKDKAQSKVCSLDNVKHKPGGGELKIFDDKNYLKQVGGSSSKASSEGIASGAQSPLPPMSPQRLSEENLVEES